VWTLLHVEQWPSRQEAMRREWHLKRDRLVANHDYVVNLKAEIEIAALPEKLVEIRSGEVATLIRELKSEMRGGKD
jgi:uncharacterized membrane protein